MASRKRFSSKRLTSRRSLRCESLESRRMLSLNGGLFAAGDYNPAFSNPSFYAPHSNETPFRVTIAQGTDANLHLGSSNVLRSRYRFTIAQRPISVESIGSPEHGVVELSSSGLAVYTPARDFVGQDTFTYEYKVGGRILERAVTINIVDPIVAVPDWFRVEQGENEVSLAVTENDTLNFGHHNVNQYMNLLSTLQITSVGELSHGGTATISEDGKGLLYTPAEGFTGLETVSYTIENSQGHSASAIVDLRVTQPGDHDTSQYTQWWKHQTIQASLESTQFGTASFEQHRINRPLIVDSWWPDSGMVLSQFDAQRGSAQMFSVANDLSDSQSSDVLTQTNAQVAGVEEADFVKTDGERLYVVQGNLSGSRLFIFDVRDPSVLTILSETEIAGQPLDLFLVDQSVVVMSQKEDGVELTSLDLTDPEAPFVNSISVMPGDYQQTRVVDGAIQVYTSMEVADVPLKLSPTSDGFFETRRQLIDRIAKLHEDSQLPVPAVVTRDADGNTDRTDPLLPHVEIVKDRSRHGGNGSLLAIGVFAGETEAETSEQSNADNSNTESSNRLRVTSQRVLGSAADLTIYSTESSVYVFNTSTLPVFDAGNRVQTIVNRFDLSDDASDMVWAAEGAFNGSLINSFSVGHHDGFLYTAATSERLGSAVYVLHKNDDTLNVIGQTEMMAPGESIYSARFVEDTAYVVTFEQVDPLFVIDLSEPTAPSVLGELKVPGFSRYLHQVQEGLLIGVGYDREAWFVDADLQVSLFDVSDSGEPKLADKLVLDRHSSPIARNGIGFSVNRWERSDHRAFSYFDSHQILALPVYRQSSLDSLSHDQSEVLLVKVDPESKELRKVGEINFEDSRVLRTLRINDALYSISRSEIQVHDLNDPATPLVTMRFEPSRVTTPETPVLPNPVVPPPFLPNPVQPNPVQPNPVQPTPIELPENETTPVVESIDTTFDYDGIAVEIQPRFVDSNGATVSSIEPGETVWLEVTAEDMRTESLGVYTAYFGIDFADAEVQLAGEAEFSDAFWVERNDPADGFHRVGASQGLSNESDPDHPWVVRMPVQFSGSGQVQVSLSPGTDAEHVALLLGVNVDIPLENIEFGQATISVVGAPMDVNRDGQITVVDPLNIINRLLERQAGTLADDFDLGRYDVSGDGEMTPNDALILINYIENEQVRAQAIMEVVNDGADDEEQDQHDAAELLLF